MPFTHNVVIFLPLKIDKRISFLLRLNAMPLSAHSTFSLPTHPSVDTVTVSCPVCCEWYWDEHAGAGILRLRFHFLWINIQKWDCWIVWQFCVESLWGTSVPSPQWLHHFTFSPAVHEGSLCSHPHSTCPLWLWRDGCVYGKHGGDGFLGVFSSSDSSSCIH